MSHQHTDPFWTCKACRPVLLAAAASFVVSAILILTSTL